MNSVVLKYQGQTVGMFVWDVIGNTANALWFVFDREIDNLGFAQVVEASRMLQKQGIEYLNLGGSETEGMDFFKTRFRPVQSFPLTSVFVEFEKHSIVSVAA
jgi:arginyl-tRNA--protein-N-Asp/Glu arginylyltransferase